MFNKIPHNLRGLILTPLLLCVALAVYAQNPVFRSSLDSNNIRTGEQTTIRLEVQCKKQADFRDITWPGVSDTLGKGIDVIQVSPIDTLTPDHRRGKEGTILVRSITITSFDSGFYAIPPFRFIFRGDSSKLLLTDAMLLHVQGMRVDTTQPIRDIKQPLPEPFDWHELIPYLKWVGLGIVILIGCALIIIRLFGKKKEKLRPSAPITPPHVLALQHLEQLRQRQLWQTGKLKEYHSTLTDIIRLYIEQRFRINAPEQTTDETLNSFRSIPLEGDLKARLKQLLYLADLVKFAKQHAMPDENEMSLMNAIAFVEGTKQEELASPNPNTHTP